MNEFETKTFDVAFNESGNFAVDFGESVSKEYHGPVHIVPTTSVQTLPTANRILTDNITIEPVPNNYGLITWNGAELIVS